MPRGFDAANDAAYAALLASLPKSEEFEHAGAIYERDGQYFFTDPMTSGSRRDVDVNVKYPKGSDLVALYHTHPKDSIRTRGMRSDQFSRSDVDISKQLGIPYYLGAVKDNSIKVFDPNKQIARHRSGTSMGKRFLAQFPVDEFKRVLAQRLRGQDGLRLEETDRRSKIAKALKGR